MQFFKFICKNADAITRVVNEQSPSGWSEVPWHTCCDPVILAAPYVIDLHHDTVARDQLAHLAEVLHEYLETGR